MHNALRDSANLSEVLWTVLPDMNVKQFQSHSIEELKTVTVLRANVRCRVISIEALPIAKSMKEKKARQALNSTN